MIGNLGERRRGRKPFGMEQRPKSCGEHWSAAAWSA